MSHGITKSIFPAKRMHWAISGREVGMIRIIYDVSVILIGLFTLLYLMAVCIKKNVEMIIYPFGGNFSIGWELGTKTSLLILSVSLLIIFSGIIYLLSVINDRPNLSWFEVQTFGEKTGLKRWDLFLVIFSVLLFSAKILSSTPLHWHHIFVFLVIFFVPLLNKRAKKEAPDLVPDDPPQPPELLQEDLIRPEPGEFDKETEDVEPECFSMNYEWSTPSHSFRINEFKILKENYYSAQKMNEVQDGDHAKRAREGETSDLRRLVREISDQVNQLQLRNVESLEALFQFIHPPNFSYALDYDSKGEKEYSRFPVETLVDKEGDCDCLSILIASLFKAYGYRASLILTPGHCQAGIEIPESVQLPGKWVEDNNGIKYYFCEATGGGWEIGERPEDVNIEEVIPV